MDSHILSAGRRSLPESDGQGREPLTTTEIIQEEPRTHRFFYGLGLVTQTFLWFLVFLGIFMAIAVESNITEFHYVGY